MFGVTDAAYASDDGIGVPNTGHVVVCLPLA